MSRRRACTLREYTPPTRDTDIIYANCRVMRASLLSVTTEVGAIHTMAVPLVVLADAIYAPSLHFVIYDVLAPLVYLSVVLAGFELAWSRTLPLRRLLAVFGASRVGDPPAFTTEPGFHTRCAVAGLAAVAMWSVAVTLWLAGYVRGAVGPALSVSQASPRMRSTSCSH